MSTTHAQGFAWAVLLALSAAAGCDGLGSRTEPAAAPAIVSSAAEDAAGPKADATTATTSPGKPLPPIDVSYTIVGAPVVGQPLQIELRTRAPFPLTALNLALSGSERLQVPAEVASLRLAYAAANERRVETISVTPLAPGRHYLSVLAQAEIDGRLQARSVTIPIDVGGAPVAPPQPESVAVDADGERIISLPAQSN